MKDESKRAAELRRIAKKNGGVLRPRDVVTFARNPKTALHGVFDWDDSVAAHEWRLEQARRVIRAHVTIIESGGNRVTTRAFVSLESQRGMESYREVEAVLSNRDWRRELLEQAKRDMKTFRQKYAALNELSAVFAAMDEAQKQCVGH